MRNVIFKLVMATLIIGGTASHSFAEMTKVGEEAMVEAGRIMYQYRCKSCHSEEGTNPSYGPPLKNVIGRKI